MWHVFVHQKSVRQLTIIYQQSTTTSPQNHHVMNARFRKTPCKNGLFTTAKKVKVCPTAKLRSPLSKAKRKRRLLTTVRCFSGPGSLQNRPHRRPPGHPPGDGPRPGL